MTDEVGRQRNGRASVARSTTERNPRTTRGRNPPAVAPPPVMGYGGGPTDLSLLPSYGN
jgi:hypothetical protein